MNLHVTCRCHWCASLTECMKDQADDCPLQPASRTCPDINSVVDPAAVPFVCPCGRKLPPGSRGVAASGCCGDGACGKEGGEDHESCPDDCHEGGNNPRT
jgi:hypothetical protein